MLQVRPLSDALQKAAEKDLNEVPKRIQEDIDHIRNWLAQQPHIRARTDDQFLLNFLRGTKFSLEKTKEKLDLFYTMRTLLPVYFTNRDPLLPEIQQALDECVFFPLPKTVGECGPRIILGRCEKLSTTKTPFPILVKTILMVVDILLYEDDNCVVGGQSLFVDFKGASLEYLLTLNPNDIKKLEMCVIDGYPTRPQAIDLINMPTVYETIINFVRSLLPTKIKNRLHIYSTRNAEDVYKIIPCSVLPREYGGECGTVDELKEMWKNKLVIYRDWLMEDEMYGVDEAKRPGKSKLTEEIFGIEGSFRKLDVD